MRTEVLKDVCISCGLCTEIEPEIYKTDDDGKASSIHGELKDDQVDRARSAADNCPVDAIEVD